MAQAFLPLAGVRVTIGVCHSTLATGLVCTRCLAGVRHADRFLSSGVVTKR